MKKQLTRLLAPVLLLLLMSSYTPDEEWGLYKKQENVLIYTKVVDVVVKGVTQKRLLFKYQNTGTTAVQVQWHLNLWYNGVCRSCDLPSPSEYDLQLTLNAGEVKEGKAEDTSLIYSVFYSTGQKNIAPLDRWEFSRFKIVNP